MHPSSRLSALARPPTPRTSRFTSPVKRRKLADGNKENLSPIKEGVEVIPIPSGSVVERIFAVSMSPPKVNLGKRRFEEDAHEDSSEDERSVVESLVRPTSSTEVEDVFFMVSGSGFEHSSFAERLVSVADTSQHQ
ncbi:hypothetical protein H0H92_001359, partial [Tricholoma furcatifolium]